jgi:hypothetical protein
VAVIAAHLSPTCDESKLKAIYDGSGLSDRRKDGFKEHNNNPSAMWRGDLLPDLRLEFELAQPAALGAIEVWNYNAQFETAIGIRKADIAVSADGTTWQTVQRGVEFAEATGADDCEALVLNLNGVTAKKVRFENITTWCASGKVGLSEVVFHSAPGAK